MKNLLLAGLLMAVLAAAVPKNLPHIQQEFTIALPSAAQSEPALTKLDGSELYVAVKGGIVNADLASKKINWKYDLPSSISDYNTFEAFYMHNKAFFAVGSGALAVLDSATGKLIHLDQDFSTYSTSSQITFGTSGDNVVILTNSQIYIVSSVTGKIISSEYATGAIYGSELYEVNQQNELIAKDLSTNKVAWTSSASKYFQRALYVNIDYVVASTNQPSGDTELFVLYRKDGTSKLKVEAMNGIDQYPGKVSITGTNLTCVAGEEYPRVYIIDINNGYILSEKPYSSGGNGGSGADQVKREDGSYIRVATNTPQPAPHQKQGFQIEHSDSTGANFKVGAGCEETSSGKTNDQGINIQYYGGGAFKIGNLQGYTFWYMDKDGSCTFLSANYAAPGWKAIALSDAPKYAGDYIEVEGDKIVAFKIVQ